jgi:phosphoglycerate dehydrogenase-like enzyme
MATLNRRDFRKESTIVLARSRLSEGEDDCRMKKILVTPRSLTKNGHPALSQLRDAGFEIVFSKAGVQPTEDELIALLPGCVGMLAGVEPITARVLASADMLRVISRNGTGINNIDMEKAAQADIKVCRAVGANARGVAELTFAHILAAARSVPFSDSAMKNEVWERRKGIELCGCTLGLVGCGNIGKIVARFALGFDMSVLAYDPYADESFNPSQFFKYCGLDDLLAQSDVISLHCPPSADGTPLVNTEAIEKMKDGVYLINTARAELLDNSAVSKALEDGKIGGLTLDVFETEPPRDWELVKHDRVVATPHIGGYTKESIDRAVGVAVDNLLTELG